VGLSWKSGGDVGLTPALAEIELPQATEVVGPLDGNFITSRYQ